MSQNINFNPAHVDDDNESFVDDSNRQMQSLDVGYQGGNVMAEVKKKKVRPASAYVSKTPNNPQRHRVSAPEQMYIRNNMGKVGRRTSANRAKPQLNNFQAGYHSVASKQALHAVTNGVAQQEYDGGSGRKGFAIHDIINRLEYDIQEQKGQTAYLMAFIKQQSSESPTDNGFNLK